MAPPDNKEKTSQRGDWPKKPNILRMYYLSRQKVDGA